VNALLHCGKDRVARWICAPIAIALIEPRPSRIHSFAAGFPSTLRNNRYFPCNPLKSWNLENSRIQR
jgi:hypothetical protein